MLRTVAFYAVAATLVAAGWLRLEEPRTPAWQAVALLALALAPALVRRAPLRAPALVAASVIAVNVAFWHAGVATDGPPRSGWISGGLPWGIADGVLGFYDVTLPFDARARAVMGGVVLLGVFALSLALALAIAARRPLLAGSLLLVGVGWPAALRPPGSELAHGAVLLAAVLALLLGLRPGRPVRPGIALGGIAAATALALSSSPAVAKDAFIAWKDWDPYTKPGRVSVRYVWDSSYEGIRFPKRKTPVLTVKAPPRPVYWRATTLDTFTGYGWIENVIFTAAAPRGSRDDLSGDPLLPGRARHAALTRQDVEVEGLSDRHLVGSAVPVAFEPGALRPATYAEGGIAFAPRDLRHGDRYTVWSFVARPTPAQLGRSQALYPPEIGVIGDFLAVAPAMNVPPFGAPGRDRQVRDLFRTYFFDERIAPYASLYRQAKRVVGSPRNPYAAAVALESWFRSAGRFAYDEQPPRASGAPALVDFVTRTRRGYCQHFAGAMALMLRYLGIPARVAAGFTSGTYDKDEGAWTVTDHNAHTWVEVWFRGYGWLPFDPTPGRGALSGSYTVASRSFDSPGAASVAAGAAAAAIRALQGISTRTARLQGVVVGERGVVGEAPAGERDHRVLWWLALAAAALVALVGLAKLGVRRARYFRAQPRRVAGACRRELVDFLTDQRIEVPPSATLAELGSILERRLAVPAGRFVAEAGAARFAPDADAPVAARRARTELRRVLRQLRRRLTVVQRARGLVSLRSLRFGS